MEIQAYKVAAMLLEHGADPFAADHHNMYVAISLPGKDFQNLRIRASF